MTRFTDGRKIVSISMTTWNGWDEHYGLDFESDFYSVGLLEYDERLDAYIIEDIEYLIGQAKDWQNGIGDYQDELEGTVGHNPDDRYVYVNGVRI